MIQNSLDRLVAGMVTSLREVVLPAVDDPYARSQLAACIELLGNVGTRVEWSRDQLDEVAGRAEAAVDDALASRPELAAALPARSADPDDHVARRTEALARVSAAIRWCGEHDADDAARPLDAFARWHLTFESALLRTGMYSA